MVNPILIYVNDIALGSVMCTDVKIEKENVFLDNERYVYSFYIFIDDQMIFGGIDKKEVIRQGNKLFIYEFER